MNYPLLYTYTKGLPYRLSLSAAGEPKINFSYTYPDNVMYPHIYYVGSVENALLKFESVPHLGYFLFSSIFYDFLVFSDKAKSCDLEFSFKFGYSLAGTLKEKGSVRFNCCNIRLEIHKHISSPSKGKYLFSYESEGSIRYDEVYKINVYSYPKSFRRSGSWGKDAPQELVKIMSEELDLKFLMVQSELARAILSQRNF